MKKKSDSNIEVKEEITTASDIQELKNDVRAIKEGLAFIVKYIKDYKLL